MSQIFRIESETRRARHIVKFYLENCDIAKYCEIIFLMVVRDIYRMADIYAKGNILYLDTPNEEATSVIARFLKKRIENLSNV